MIVRFRRGTAALMLICAALTGMIAFTMLSAISPIFAQSDAAFAFATNTPQANTQSQTDTNPPPTVIESNGGAFDPTVCAPFTDGGELSPECLAIIEANPRPLVNQVPLDAYTIDTYSFWRVGRDATPTYDAPGGNLIGEIPAGFNFVNAINTNVEGWLQIQGGQWIERNRATYAQPSFFRGVTLQSDTVLPFAFVLDLSRIPVSRYPGGERDNSTGRFLQRYELVNIFATAYDEEGWRWYMIGPNQWVEQRFVAKVQRIERPEGISGQWIAVDLYEQTLVAYQDDTPVYATLISSGLERTETNEGLFNVWARLPSDGMSGATGAPNAYALQSVPWVMYFDGSISLHGTYWHDLFGYRQSRGCVNLTISDARWVFEWTGQGEPDAEGNISTPVYVYSSGEYGVTASGL